MAKVFLFSTFLLSVLSRADSCFLPAPRYVIVPQTLRAGFQIPTVQLADCVAKSMRVTVSDPRFELTPSGVLRASADVSVAAAGRTFYVRAEDESGAVSEMVVHLVRSVTSTKDQTPAGFLKRFKRRWSPPPFNILENDAGPFPKVIDKIVSDSEVKYNVYYIISGPGVTQHPLGLFSLDRDSGMLKVHKSVDREEFPRFLLKTQVFDVNTNAETDLPLNIEILVDDVNDNAPTFKDQLQYTVLEQSIPGTAVGKVNATDRDKPGSLHVKIRYTLLTGLDLFAINPATGVITTVTNTLDREVKDKHLVTVKIADMDGAVGGLSNTATATITVGDINDNPPTFTKTSYAVSAKENEREKLILRIPVEDKDLEKTPNWISKFVITKGNENGNFRIDTDAKTNDGLLYISKPLDYELTKKVKLEITARNQANLIGTSAPWLTIPVDVAVTDEDEGPEFTAPTYTFNVKENTANGTRIGAYTALDPETKSSNGIKYYKVLEPAHWFSVDRNNGELRVANTIDRESHFVHSGLYNFTVKAVDASSKTGTGTVIVVVEDANDNVPTLPSAERVVCEREGQLGSVVVVAEDNDQSPYSSPFSFSLPRDHDGKWSLTKLNDTAATLQQMKLLPTGMYHVPVEVSDLQGYGKPQTAIVRICRCENGACLANQSSVSLGPLALLAMLLPLALLLLLALLLAFFCVTKMETLEMDDGGDSGGILLKSNTESPGEEVDSSLITIPAQVKTGVKGSVKGSVVSGGWIPNQNTLGGQNTQENGLYVSDTIGTTDVHKFYSGQYNQLGTQQFGGTLTGSAAGFDNGYLTQDSSFFRNWQTNGRYLHQKLAYFGTEEDGRYADDVVHCYGYEGVGSAAGSMGCCSDFGDSDNLDFLNALGPKFKTLADVGRKT